MEALFFTEYKKEVWQSCMLFMKRITFWKPCVCIVTYIHIRILISHESPFSEDKPVLSAAGP